MNDINFDELQSIFAFIDKPNDWKNVNTVSKKWKKTADRIKDDKATQFSKMVLNHKEIVRDDMYETSTHRYYTLPNGVIHGEYVTVTNIRKRFFVFEDPSITTVKRFKFGKDITPGMSVTMKE